MKMKIVILLLVIAIPAAVSGKEQGKSLSVDTIQVLKISGQDQRAVIKTPDGKMQIIKVGDPVGDHGKVIEIIKDRVVIEETDSNGAQKVVIRLENGKQRVERLRKTGEKQPVLLAPPSPGDAHGQGSRNSFK